jgi:hypothetical protein
MKYCTSCGAKNWDSAKFCTSCGAKSEAQLENTVPMSGKISPVPEHVVSPPRAAVPPDASANPNVAAISFHCTACTQPLEAPSEMADNQIECPACGKAIRIPLSRRASAGNPVVKVSVGLPPPIPADRLIRPAEMPSITFTYTALTKSGEKVSGTVSAADKVDAIRAIERLGHVPVSVVAQDKPASRGPGSAGTAPASQAGTETASIQKAAAMPQAGLKNPESPAGVRPPYGQDSSDQSKLIPTGPVCCPNGHGILKPWSGGRRCWTCGWPDEAAVNLWKSRGGLPNLIHCPQCGRDVSITAEGKCTICSEDLLSHSERETAAELITVVGKPTVTKPNRPKVPVFWIGVGVATLLLLSKGGLDAAGGVFNFIVLAVLGGFAWANFHDKK